MPHRLDAVLIFILGSWVIAERSEAWVANGYVWPGSHPRVPYYISTSLEGNVPYDGSAPFEEVIEHINNAADEWNTAGGSELQFFYAGLSDVASVADDGINVIAYSPGQCPHPGTGCPAWITYHVSGSEFHGFDVTLYQYRADNGALVKWKTQMTHPTHTDLWSTVLHEFGHALGLAHSDDGNVMGACGPGCTRRYLYADDIAGAQAVNGVYTNEGFWASMTAARPGESFTLYLDYPESANQPANRRDYSVRYSTNATGGMNGFPLRDWADPNDSRIFPLSNVGEPAEPPIFVNGQGTLSATGQATVTVNLPADAPQLLGTDLYLACWKANNQVISHIEDVSVGVRVRIVAPADLDRDGDADFDDVTLFENCMTGPDVITPPPGCDPIAFADADLSDDGDVDCGDFALYQTLFSGA